MEYKITGNTQLTGLLGSPVRHSISPMMHNEAFRQLGLDYVYLAFEVGEDDLQTAVDGLRAMGIRGFNLTMPNKNQMCLLADELSPAARIMGAVNTIVNENGRLIGYSTDGIGFMHSVKEKGQNIIGEKMTLLGAGGASVSIMVQAALDGVEEISVFSRKGKFYERAERVISDLREISCCRIRLYDFSDSETLKKEVHDSKILVNGTSVGMSPETEASIITDVDVFYEGLYVYDVIYNPKETLLLKKAMMAGCETQNGLDMLLYQGAEAFRLWTGQEMPVDVIKQKYFQC